MKRVDRVVGIAFLIFGLVAAFESLRLGLERSGLPGSGLFPLIASCGIAGLATLQIIQSRSIPEDEKPAWPSSDGLKKTLLFAAGLMLYVILTVPLGFLISSILFLTALIHYLGGYGWRTTFAVSLSLSFALYFGLGMLLGVEVPHGILRFIGL